MPSHSTILLDNNALSRSELADRVRGKTIYLPDAVMYELFGGGEWERSISHCLAPLAPFADHVVGTVNLGKLLHHELVTGEPAQSIVGDPIVNARLAPLLRGCLVQSPRAVDYFREGQPTVPIERVSRMALVPGYRTLSTDVAERVKKQAERSELDRLRNEPALVARFLKGIDLRPMAIEGLRQLPIVGRFDCPRWDPIKMASVPCCWMRMLLSDLCLGIRRAVKPRFANASDDELHGDQIDGEIAILATYADEFLSFDAGALWIEKALRGCISELF